MDANFLHATTLKTASIQQVNDALIVLRHFVDLNYKLLPLFHDLHLKKIATKQDKADIEKIEKVFETYHFDIQSSVILMNSPILELIQETYTAITNPQESYQAAYQLLLFKKEYKRLEKNWHLIRNN
jgi:hypothetical protein